MSTRLLPGITFAGSFATIGVARYEVLAPPHSVVIGTIDQLELDVVVDTFEAGTGRVREWDGVGGSRGSEAFVIDAEAGGSYRIDVRPFDPRVATHGLYRLVVTVRPSDDYENELGTRRFRYLTSSTI